MDTAEDELRKDVRDVAITRIQNLLQLAVQTSTLATDLHREDLSCSLAPHNLIQHLHLIQSAGDMLPIHATSTTSTSSAVTASGSTITATLTSSVNEAQGLKGFEALTLEYKVGWPMSIVLSKRAITKYQLLSRLLYFSKHVERRVLVCWSDHQTTKQLNVRQALGRSYCLRHRMLHFLQNFVYYMTFEVIYPRSHEMESSMTTAKDVDEMLMYHERFLDICLKECLLASQDLLKILTKIMTTCLLFADNLKRSYAENDNSTTSTASSSSSAAAGSMKRSGSSTTPRNAAAAQPASQPSMTKKQRSEFIHKETAHESFLKMLYKFESTFDSQVSIILL
jgi:gamma-tubulin complex component 2